MLIVCSLEAAKSAFRLHRPAAVLSLLSEDEEIPTFDGLPTAAHLKLYVEQESCAQAISDAARKRAAEIVDFASGWDRDGDVLLHCKRGVSRSVAAAYIILCAKLPEADERELLKRLRRSAPHGDPCPLLVSYADDLLGRDGRMLDAVEELGPPTTVLSAPVATIDLAA